MSAPLPLHRPSRPTPPVFSRVAIVGLGLIGGSLAMAVRRRWPESLVIGVDHKPIVEQAMVLHAIDVGAEDLGMITGAELVVLAAPVGEICRLLESGLSGLVEPGTVVTDVGSTKAAVMRAAGALPPGARFIGGHPLAGAAASGLEHARADLFDGRPWCLCPAPDGLLRVDEFVQALGAAPAMMSPDEHDRLLAFLSHLPQLAVSSLMEVIGGEVKDAGLALAGRGLQDTTRLATSPPGIWKDVCQTNATHIGEALDRLIARLQELRAGLDDAELIDQLFASAQRWKSKMSPRT
jgi:prephenate dehydrogenase